MFSRLAIVCSLLSFRRADSFGLGVSPIALLLYANFGDLSTPLRGCLRFANSSPLGMEFRKKIFSSSAAASALSPVWPRAYACTSSWPHVRPRGHAPALVRPRGHVGICVCARALVATCLGLTRNALGVPRGEVAVAAVLGHCGRESGLVEQVAVLHVLDDLVVGLVASDLREGFAGDVVPVVIHAPFGDVGAELDGGDQGISFESAPEDSDLNRGAVGDVDGSVAVTVTAVVSAEIVFRVSLDVFSVIIASEV